VPFDFDPSGIAASCDLGDDSSHAPQIRFTAPNKSCLWNDFPVRIKCNAFSGCIAPVDPAPSYQITGYPTPFGAGPFTPPDNVWPAIHLYGILNPILCGYTFEYRVTGNITFGSSQIGVANTLTGCGGCSDPNYYFIGPYDTGWQDAGGPDCAQAATATDDHMYFTLALRPFSPIAGAGFTNGKLEIRWVGGGGTPPDYDPVQPYAIFFAAPGDNGTRDLRLGDCDGASPPTSDWTNSVVVGDAGIEDISCTPQFGVQAVGGGHGTMFYNAWRFEAQQAVELYAQPKPTGTDAIYIFLRLQDPGLAGVDGYYLKGTNTQAQIFRLDNGSSTLLATIPLPYPMARAMGYRFWATGSLLGVQANIDKPNSFGSELPFIGSATDTTYADDGYVGVGIDGSTGILVSAWATNGNGSGVFPGLTIWLPTNSCGVVTKTYNQIKADIDAMNAAHTCPILATIIAHGTDTAAPDDGGMQGAHCTGGTYWREGMETP
jgi:hypothetical protein